jgi:acyl-CoA synthetase (AMP-forming)/AMP-acid ligase II
MRTIDYFDKGAAIDPDRIALVDSGTRITYRDAQAATRRIAVALRGSGVKPQDPVAIYAPNAASVMLCLWGLWRADAIWVPVSARNALDANIQYLNYVRAVALFYHSSVAGDAAKLKAAVPTLRLLICMDAAESGNASLEAFMVKDESAPQDDCGDPFGNLDHVVGIFPTGGTTGPSKGVNVTNLGWGTMIETALGAWHRGVSHPICLSTAPLTHAAGPMATVMAVLGATKHILARFDALEVLRAIERHKVTHFYLPPTALYALLDYPRLNEFDTSSLQLFLLAGSPVSPDRLKRAVEVFGPCMAQSYGQVEAPMILTYLPPEIVAAAARGDHPERLRSCGRATNAVRVEIMDEEGRFLPDGEPGEIVARGALVSHSYFQMPEASTEIHKFGWHHTGDVAYRDESGFFYIVDRKKDMVVTGGFNVFSAEVEACVMELPSVRECAVIGVPHERWGEAVTALVVPAKNAQLTEDEIIAHCKARLGGVKAPKAVHLCGELPKTQAGKLDKKAMRALFWAGRERSVN